MDEQRAKGLCYNCDELYTSGHRCKRLFWIEAFDDLYENIDDSGTDRPEISIHALAAPKGLRLCRSTVS